MLRRPLRALSTLAISTALVALCACEPDSDTASPSPADQAAEPSTEEAGAGPEAGPEAAPEEPNPWLDFRALVDKLEADVRARAAETTDPDELETFASEWHAEHREAIAAAATLMQELVLAEPDRYALPVAQNIRYQLTLLPRFQGLVEEIRATSDQPDHDLAWNEFEVAILEFNTIALEATESITPPGE
ncbi:hypothetical protein BH23VER1_BH23VER1_32770 [soil metagenome]